MMVSFLVAFIGEQYEGFTKIKQILNNNKVIIINMNKTFCLLVGMTMALYTHGQTIGHETNAPRCGDSYTLRQLDYFSPGNEGKDVVWDFSELKSTGRKVQKEYFLSTDSVLSCVDGESLSRYSLTDDTLYCLGYDTRLKHMDYTQPMTMMTYPFSYGYSITNPYGGTGDYCKRLILKNGGTLMVEADAEGVIINQEGDTLKNVLRVHTTRLNSVSMHALSDTLMSDTSRMKQEIEERYAWYVRGYRYPMYETSSICFYDNMTPVYCIQKAKHYCADDMSEMSDSINEEILATDSIANVAEQDIIHYTIKNDGCTLTMDYSLDADASINALVSNSRGMLYGRRSTRQPAGTDYQMDFEIVSLPKGEYVLYVNVNGKVYNEKFRK